MNWADELIGEYKAGRKGLKIMKDELTDYPQDEQDKTQINSMIDSMSYSIKWMETGQQPDAYRGVGIRGIYQFEDMDIIPDINEQLREEREELYMSQEQRQSLLRLFRMLSARERQCYIMHEAEKLSMAEISAKLGISKATVQVYIKRAREKVEMIAS